MATIKTHLFTLNFLIVKSPSLLINEQPICMFTAAQGLGKKANEENGELKDEKEII